MASKQERIDRLLSEKMELEKELHAMRCKYGDLADLVSEVACDYEAGKELVFLSDLVAKYREQQNS